MGSWSYDVTSDLVKTIKNLIIGEQVVLIHKADSGG